MKLHNIKIKLGPNRWDSVVEIDGEKIACKSVSVYFSADQKPLVRLEVPAESVEIEGKGEVVIDKK